MDEKEFDYMNVIPLVDIMLVLLTIVLTTATFLNINAIPVALPKTEEGKGLKNNKSIIITIDKDGNFYINRERVNTEELENRLDSFNRNTLINLSADKRANIEHLVKILDILQNKKFKNISLITLKE